MNSIIKNKIEEKVQEILALMEKEKQLRAKLPVEGVFSFDMLDINEEMVTPEMREYLDASTRRCDNELDLIMLLRKCGGIDE